MNEWFLLAAVLIPIVGGIGVVLLPFHKKAQMEIYLEIVVIANALLVFSLLLHRPGELLLFHFAENAAFAFKIDGFGSVFAGLISILWPIAILYSYEYMTKEERERPFFMFYTMTYGVTLGIAFSANLMTMYFFYEMLTLVTVPLVLHTFTREAVLATRKYIYFSMGGAALGFIGLIYIMMCGTGGNFAIGGILGDLSHLNMNYLYVVYVVAFCGFSIKAAMFPFYSWLPDAGVAPTPVTALLHAVAVVKAGAFAVIRLTYYCFGADVLRGSWAQTVVMVLAMITIVFGCSMAVKETHLKRRLAFSTVSNLSYIIFGATLMTPLGLFGALCHMCFHAVMKICSFFCAGAIMHQTECHYVHELDGFGRKMPWVFGTFTVSALGLMGVPGFCGFISKWNLAQAAIETGEVLPIVGVGCLLVSALLTAIYMMSIVVRGFFPSKEFDMGQIEHVKDPNWKMVVPLALFAVAIVGMGVYSAPLTELLEKVAYGIF